MTASRLQALSVRAAAELVLFAAIGLFLGFVGAYGTDRLPAATRFLYWVGCIVGGGLFGVAIDEAVAARTRRLGLRLAVASLLMTPPVALWVILMGRLMAREPISLGEYGALLPRVLAISAPVVAVRALVWRRPEPVIETRTVVEPPLPEAEAAFRRRLSARRRGARLIAVEAEDHYVRVHTDAGAELVTLRFIDALAELARAHGYRTHRSWWVAHAAIEGARWRRGTGELRLEGGLVAPVSRSYAAALREAGWL
jgi:hypothetical protein